MNKKLNVCKLFCIKQALNTNSGHKSYTCKNILVFTTLVYLKNMNSVNTTEYKVVSFSLL